MPRSVEPWLWTAGFKGGSKALLPLDVLASLSAVLLEVARLLAPVAYFRPWCPGRLLLQLSLSSPSEPLLGPAAPPVPCCAGVEPPGPALLAPPHQHPRASSAEPQPGGRTKKEGRMSRRRDGGCSPSTKRSQRSIAGLTASACDAFSLVVSISRCCAYPTTLSSIPCRRPWNEVSRAERPRWSPKVAARTAKTWAAVSASPAARVSTSLRAYPSNAWINHSTAVPSSILKFRRMSSASWINSSASQPSASPVKRGSFGSWMARHGSCSAMLLLVGSSWTASKQLLYTVSWLVVTLLHPILLASTSFCRGAVWGVEGKQVGSMNEEPQVRGCCNITFICTPTNQETVSVMEKTQANKTFRIWKQT